ncbi:MAG: Asp-tRNA(Asn)/Glu-tRNA(Gln) amidotransferase GatCAB subunit B, partial [Verrucomicrobia bacterium]|nr:Asp-tRNA(Asn)/Glu-tRNA(Gln) amidotransferase GatCAB subunit B [Verrucomicrobiota bacterium]
NMNSFSGVRRALNYEIPRQIEAVKNNEPILQETRRWDDVAGITESMRSKEDAHDYRYFPDPDLMAFEPSDAWFEEVRKGVVELPLARKKRFIKEYKLPDGDAEVFVNDVPLGDYFEQIAGKVQQPKALANWIINNLQAKLTESESKLQDLKFEASALLELINLVDSGKISTKIAQTVFSEMFETGKSPSVIVEEKGLVQVSDSGAIETFCQQAIDANPGPADDFRNGKEAALNYLKGQVMKLSRGKANPALVGEVLRRILNG